MEEILDVNVYVFCGSMLLGMIQFVWVYDLFVDGESFDILVEIFLWFFVL